MTTDGLTETLTLLDNIIAPEKIELFLERLAETGIGKAQRIYGVSTSEAQTPDLSYEFIDNNTVCVKASGEDVLFLEFGTGITYMQEYPTDEGFTPIFYAGDWSDNEELGGKHHWRNPNGWYIPGGHGKHTYGIAPARAMYEAKKEIKQQIEIIAREVFGI
ncbi:MAG: hypothetical protein J6S85_02570 [Methanobrevibacter sp.]|nr:hypothetical protein [Methanobrevibacter sp.]